MSGKILKHAKVVNEGQVLEADILIRGELIERIDRDISDKGAEVLDLNGKYILPGIIDDQVHFREPGLTHKGNIASESRAALAGGITSYMEQPNTNPTTTTLKRLEEKFSIAANSSFANFSFLFGGTNDNLEEIKRLDKRSCSGIKLFLGSSTGNMLVDDLDIIEAIFRNTELVISAHCEDETTIRNNLARMKAQYGDDIPIAMHPVIRSAEACYLSSSRAIELAQKTGARLHVFHVSTARETHLFRNDIPLEEKKITSEVCLHHLWFTDTDYREKGTLIKWNPAVKSAADRDELWKAVLDDRIDIIATDHAPHTEEEKKAVYTKAPSGGPLVQHLLPGLLEKHLEGALSLETIVAKTSHNPAILFDIARRGFIKEGFYADLAVVTLNRPWTVAENNILYHCGWSPFEGTEFRSAVTHTFINGHLGYSNGKVSADRRGKRLTFNR